MVSYLEPKARIHHPTMWPLWRTLVLAGKAWRRADNPPQALQRHHHWPAPVLE